MTHLYATPAKQLRELYGTKKFVETGCEDGEGLSLAKSYGFLESDLYSCDIRLEAVEKVSAMLPLAHVVNMDSLVFLTALLPVLHGPTMFWLDAHFPELYNAEATLETNWPLLAELELIRTLKTDISQDIIICDDMRVIQSPSNPRWNEAEMQRDGVQYIVPLNDWQDFVGILGETHTHESILVDTGISIFYPKGK